MYKIDGSPLCPDCRECKANFDAHGIAYEEVNITGSMAELKEFLKLRDSEAVFAPCKERGSVGIPAIVKEDGSIELIRRAQTIDDYFATLKYPGSLL